METTPSPSPRPSKDRAIAVGMVTLAALLASGWIMRERQWATDLAESREDLRQALHRLQTLSASTDQIRSAYIQRKTELENTRKKLESATTRTQEEKSKPSSPASTSDKPKENPAISTLMVRSAYIQRKTELENTRKKLESATARTQEEKSKPSSPASTSDKPKENPAISTLMEKIGQAKLPAWAAVEKTPTAIRVLPGVGVPGGNEAFSAFGSLAPTLAGLDSTSTLELIGRAEPGNDAWETAQERAHRLLSSAEKSLKGQTGRIRLRIEVVKGPRMEWRILPADATPSANPEAKPTHK